MALSSRENFLRMFRGQPADKILWVSDLTYWRDAQIIQKKLPSKYLGSNGFLQLHIDLGVMPYYIYAIDEDTANVETEPKEISIHQIGGSGKPYNGVFGLKYEDMDIKNSTYKNVIETKFFIKGEVLIQKKVYLPQSFCYGFKEYPVKTPKDLKILRSIVERYCFYSTFEDYEWLAEKWGDHGVPIAPLPRSPLSALIVDWMGLEGFSYANYDYPEEIKKTIDSIDRANDKAFKIIVNSPAEVFHFCDNLSASNFASFFSMYADEYYRRRLQQLHLHGKKAAVHIDGTIRGILDQVSQTGADAAEALTPKPVGDLAIQELRREAGNDTLILWGGFPGGMFTHQFDYQDLQKQVASFLRCFYREGPFIAGSADQIPPDADLDYVRYVSDLLSKPEVTLNETP